MRLEYTIVPTPEGPAASVPLSLAQLRGDDVRRKAVEAGIAYPIAVDNNSANWDAGANRVWPSVYLIDKRGFVRYWWYGQMNWQGVEGEKWMRSRIRQLLAEPD